MPARAGAIDGIWDSLEDLMVAGLDGKDRKRLRKLLRKIEKNLATQLGAAPESLAEADVEEEAETAEEPA